MLHAFFLPIGSMDADSPECPRPVLPVGTRQRDIVRARDSGWLRKFFLKRASRPDAHRQTNEQRDFPNVVHGDPPDLFHRK
jgi:hypothetical protein